MYFWKIGKLKKDLVQNPLSEKEQCKYLLATTMVISLGAVPFMENNIWDVCLAIVSGVITLLGTYYVYRKNGGSNGRYILQRLFSLGWVVGIRWLILIMLPLAIFFFTVLGIFSTVVHEYAVHEHTTVYDVMVFSVIYVPYFWLLGKHIKDVSVKSNTSK